MPQCIFSPTNGDTGENLVRELTLSQTTLEQMMETMVHEVRASLREHQRDPYGVFDVGRADFMANDTCLSSTPNGTENGTYYGVDVGGTNCRVLRCKLLGKGLSEVTSVEVDLRKHEVGLPTGLLDKKATATMLFDFLAIQIRDFIKSNGDEDKRLGIGFCFSFGIQQLLVDSAVLISMSKGWETGSGTDDPVVGQDICLMLNKALQRCGVDGYVAGALNDTTGTLLCASYEKGSKKPPAHIAMIVGTGFNIAILEPSAVKYSYEGNIVNLEGGGFTGCPNTIVDVEIDNLSTNKGRQSAEKKVSGLFLGELCRICIRRALRDKAPRLLYIPGSLETPEVAKIYGADDAITQCRVTLEAVLNESIPEEVIPICIQLIDAVFNRSADIVGAMLGGVAIRSDRLRKSLGGISVGVDGSVFLKNPRYRRRITETIERLLGPRADLIHFVPTSDGSGKGAALLAAAEAKRLSKHI